MPNTLQYQNLFTGLDLPTPLLNHPPQPYVNLDNAASTPALKAVLEAIDRFMPYYSSVHRGSGFKSQVSTRAYEIARERTLQFVKADPGEHTCIFGKNTTEAINKLARRFPFHPGKDVVLTSGLEHHSNDLPWRLAAHAVHIRLTSEGRLDLADYEAKLEAYAGRVALVSISAASNVTGYITPIHQMAEMAHAAGAQILADCAQLAAHRSIEMLPGQDPAHLDYVVLSAHKMYAPFGTGALVGLRETFEQGDPDMRGGGTVEIVTLDDVVWAEPPDREEAGSPNTVGAVALAAALRQLQEVGMDSIAAHEAELTAYALERLPEVPGISIYGDRRPENAAGRVGVIPFGLDGVSHFKVSAILGCEFGIGVRSGCFCAHPYILHLLGLSQVEARQVRQHMLAGDRSDMPGLVRLSFGLYNTTQDVDRLVEALVCIAEGKYTGEYVQERSSGEYQPRGWEPDLDQYLKL